MVNVVNSLPRSNSGHPQLISHQIEWVECGDPTSTGDLYDNGFINTDSARTLFNGLIFTDIIFPIVIYAMMLVYRILSHKSDD